jgi:prepilin-type N-terminal cleavage/methylation domain-containing protein
MKDIKNKATKPEFFRQKTVTAFTLIELLVVISIIAILAALAKAKARAQQSYCYCSKSLGQFGVAAQVVCWLASSANEFARVGPR